MSDTPSKNESDKNLINGSGSESLASFSIRRLEIELAEAKRGAARYEVVRKMNSDDFRKLYLRCVFENLRFDDEVDKIGGLK